MMSWPTGWATWSAGSPRSSAATGTAGSRWPGPPSAGAELLEEAIRRAPGRVDAALDGFDFRAATAAVWDIVDEANRYVSQARPWELAALERAGDREAGRQLDASLATLIGACRAVAGLLAPFVPDAAARVAQQCAPRTGGCRPRSRSSAASRSRGRPTRVPAPR